MGVWVFVKSETFSLLLSIVNLLLSSTFLEDLRSLHNLHHRETLSQITQRRDAPSSGAFLWGRVTNGGPGWGVRVNCHRTYARDGDDESGDDSHLTKSPMEALQWWFRVNRNRAHPDPFCGKVGPAWSSDSFDTSVSDANFLWDQLA